MEWVKLSEKKPTESGNYVLWKKCNIGQYLIDSLYLIIDPAIEPIAPHCRKWKSLGVTHWMLIKSPKEDSV